MLILTHCFQVGGSISEFAAGGFNGPDALERNFRLLEHGIANSRGSEVSFHIHFILLKFERETSESMEPYVRRGDILFLAMGPERVKTGDICVYKLSGREIPIVHRVITAHDE